MASFFRCLSFSVIVCINNISVFSFFYSHLLKKTLYLHRDLSISLTNLNILKRMKNFFTLLFVSLFTVLAASAEDTYVVAGVEVMMGSNWKGADADNQMTSSDGGETYTLVKEGVKLEAGIEIGRASCRERV